MPWRSLYLLVMSLSPMEQRVVGAEVAVSRILFPRRLTAPRTAIISLGRRLPAASSSQPGGQQASHPRAPRQA